MAPADRLFQRTTKARQSDISTSMVFLTDPEYHVGNFNINYDLRNHFRNTMCGNILFWALNEVLLRNMRSLYTFWREKTPFTNVQVKEAKAHCHKLGEAWLKLGWKSTPWLHWTVAHCGAVLPKCCNLYVFSNMRAKHIDSSPDVLCTLSDDSDLTMAPHNAACMVPSSKIMTAPSCPVMTIDSLRDVGCCYQWWAPLDSMFGSSQIGIDTVWVIKATPWDGAANGRISTVWQHVLQRHKVGGCQIFKGFPSLTGCWGRDFLTLCVGRSPSNRVQPPFPLCCLAGIGIIFI